MQYQTWLSGFGRFLIRDKLKQNSILQPDGLHAEYYQELNMNLGVSLA